MPAFTAVATYLVTAATSAAFVATTAGMFVVSVVATGLALVTSRLINGSGSRAGGTQQDPGVRVQLPPATNNKVPICYGTVYTKGIVTDARISNENKTMTYVLVLSELTQTGVFSVGDIFWADSKLVFDPDVGEGHIVRSSIDQNGLGNTSTSYDGLIRIRVYSGGTNANKQIFPTTGTQVSARDLLSESDTNYQLNDLVFAVVQIDYNSEKGITGLQNLTFQLTNTLKNPGEVWYDYITSDRYGAGLPLNQVDTQSSISTATTSLLSISNTIPSNQYLPGGTTATNQVRYEINGVLSPGDTVKNNLERINLASASWTTFDYSDGKWKVIPNRAATVGELAQAFSFTDDNIIGDVGITATNLEDLYNTLEVEFASRNIRDQNDYYRGSIAAGQRNDLEPDNTLNLRLDLVNNAIHAARVGLIELKQSRVDLIITFLADYSAIQCEAGDVIKVTNSVYGFSEKLFRVTKIREVEDESAGLTVEVTALEYDSGIYTDENLSDYAANTASGIPIQGGTVNLPPPSAPTVNSSNPTANIPNFTLRTTIDANSGPVQLIEWFYSTNISGTYSYLANERSATGNFGAGTVVTDVITGLGAGTYYFKARTSSSGLYSALSGPSTAFVWNPQPAGASGGSITTSTYADQVLTTAVTTGDYNITMVDIMNDYQTMHGNTGLTYNAATQTLFTPNLQTTNIANTGTAGSTYIADVSSTVQNYNNGATVDFANFSGMIIVNRQDVGSGNVALWIVGSGATLKLGDSIGNQSGTITVNGGINGYTWTNNTGGTIGATFAAIRTRASA